MIAIKITANGQQSSSERVFKEITMGEVALALLRLEHVKKELLNFKFKFGVEVKKWWASTN